jgi:hypothetical protein
MSIRKTILSACGGLVLVVYATAFVRYAPTFHDEGSLWLRAVQIAPLKPRPHAQLVLALIERHRFSEAQIVLDDLDAILRNTDTPIPAFDRREAMAASHTQRLLLSRAAGTGPWR